METRSQGEAADAQEEFDEERCKNEERSRGSVSREPTASPTIPKEDSARTTRQVGDPLTRDINRERATPPRSQRTSHSALRRRLAELEAAEKLAEIRRQELAIETDLVKKRLAVQIAEESVHDEPAAPADNGKVDQWLENMTIQGGPDGPPAPRPCAPKERNRSRSPTPEHFQSVRMQIAEALDRMARPQRRYCCELPTFSGSPHEWLLFRAAVYDSTFMYNIPSAENLLRLQNSLKGEARAAVAPLLYTATEPEIVMKTLEQCFGRPEMLIDHLLEELKNLPRPGPAASDLNAFAVKIQNIVYALQNIDGRGYFHSPRLAREVLGKLSPHIQSKWCDYAHDRRETNEIEIVLLSQFLMREADIALQYTYAPSSSTAQKNIEQCPYCGDAHKLIQCPTYRALTVSQRWDMVKEKGLCFKCADEKHRRMLCKAKVCGVNQCRRPHHSSLHKEYLTTEASNRN